MIDIEVFLSLVFKIFIFVRDFIKLYIVLEKYISILRRCILSGIIKSIWV